MAQTCIPLKVLKRYCLKTMEMNDAPVKSFWVWSAFYQPRSGMVMKRCGFSGRRRRNRCLSKKGVFWLAHFVWPHGSFIIWSSMVVTLALFGYLYHLYQPRNHCFLSLFGIFCLVFMKNLIFSKPYYDFLSISMFPHFANIFDIL